MVKQNDKWDSIKTVALIGNHLPRQCGIATFTTDLANATANVAPDINCWTLAINDRESGYPYPERVKFEIHQDKLSDYRLAADFLNMSSVDLVCLQHEYGIFGGTDGQHIIQLLRRLRAPVATTLHTVLKEPTEGQRRTMQKIADLSDRLIVIAERAVQFLEHIYDIPPHKIVYIPHGIPDTPFVDPTYYKDEFGAQGKKVIMTFGLLSPDKGIETMIDALPMVAHAHPDVVYIVLGATHPHVQAHSGEDYRLRLQRRAEDMNVADRIMFHDRFIQLEELCEYLSAADVYVTPYLKESQIVSGTLAYALGTGNAVVSTPYWYAQEMLADKRGLLVPFRDAQKMAAAIIGLFDHEVDRHAMRKRAYSFTRRMIWPEVGRQYMDLFAEIKSERSRMPRPRVSATRPTRMAATERIRFDHLFALTDDTGILQHARGITPNRAYGYCTDDNARALITVIRARDLLSHEETCRVLAGRYLSFLDHAFDRSTGCFHNFMGFDRRWLDDVGSEDCQGRAIWALGQTVAHSEVSLEVAVASEMLHQALSPMLKLKHLRAWAYGLLGTEAYLSHFGGDSDVRRVSEQLSLRLLDQFRQNATEQWPWPEDRLTYANARLPHALLLSGQRMSSQSMIDAALRALEWLVRVQTTTEGHFAPIGNRGWYAQDGKQARFDQQPIEAAGMIDACLEAAGVTGESHWVESARGCLNWFLGDNDLRMPLSDPTTGGCRDGLGPEGTNENQGAESTLSWLMSALALQAYELDTSVMSDDEAIATASGV